MTAADTSTLPVANRGIITVSVMLATVMQALDTTIANVALPHVQGALSATKDEMGWVLTSYIVAAAITIPLTGSLANFIGRRRVFLWSIVLFTIASLLCGAAQSLPQIVFFRFLQGVGGAALVPLSQAVLFDINQPKDFGRVMAIWVGCVQGGNIFGPALGGWLTEDYSWRWVFYINLPVGVLAFSGLLLTLPETPKRTGSRFDIFGFAALSLAVAGLQLLLDRGQLLDWFSSPEIITEAVVAGLAFYLFIVHTLTSRDPFLNPALFIDTNFVISSLFVFLIGVVVFATLALLPPMLQEQLRYPVVLTGLVTAPRGIGTLAGMVVTGRLIGKVDIRLLLIIGLLLTAYSLWQMTQYSLLMGYGPVVVSGLLQGIGVALIYLPISTSAFLTLPVALRNEGTAFFNLSRNIGSSIGISVVLFTLTQNTQRLTASIGEHITAYNMAANPAAIAAHADVGTGGGLAALAASIGDQAAMIAYIDDFKLMMIATLLTLPFVLFLRSAKTRAADHLVVIE